MFFIFIKKEEQKAYFGHTYDWYTIKKYKNKNKMSQHDFSAPPMEQKYYSASSPSSSSSPVPVQAQAPPAVYMNNNNGNGNGSGGSSSVVVVTAGNQQTCWHNDCMHCVCCCCTGGLWGICWLISCFDRGIAPTTVVTNLQNNR